jgi:hypothetical protein
MPYVLSHKYVALMLQSSSAGTSASRPVLSISMDVQDTCYRVAATAGSSQVQPISAEASNAMWMVSMMIKVYLLQADPAA